MFIIKLNINISYKIIKSLLYIKYSKFEKKYQIY